MNRAELVKNHFTGGCNCAQAVFLAFSDLTKLDKSTALRLTASFGGGFGRLREVCGAVSGMVMALGLLYASDDIADTTQKATHYQRVQELAAKFKEINGSIICRELLDGTPTTAGYAPEARTETYYAKRPCAELCATAAEILEQYIQEHPL